VPVKPSQNREAAREAFGAVRISVLEGVDR
jgi:hypothetical protein